MSNCCNGGCSNSQAPDDPRYRRALRWALIINSVMFAIELASGIQAGSVSLLADAVDFLGDAGNYALSLYVLSMGMLWRARAALFKGLTMGAYGIFILSKAAWTLKSGTLPEALTMSAVGALAFAANGIVAVLLYTFRSGDANMRSVWLCTRNDMVGNLAVILAAAGVFGTHSGWPDLLVACVMGALGLSAAAAVIRQARQELAKPASLQPTEWRRQSK
ncbi:MAG TPA: cation transporter [Pseudoduganella sp.]